MKRKGFEIKFFSLSTCVKCFVMLFFVLYCDFFYIFYIIYYEIIILCNVK